MYFYLEPDLKIKWTVLGNAVKFHICVMNITLLFKIFALTNKSLYIALCKNVDNILYLLLFIALNHTLKHFALRQSVPVRRGMHQMIKIIFCWFCLF